jgi:hypothetical protein
MPTAAVGEFGEWLARGASRQQLVFAGSEELFHFVGICVSYISAQEGCPGAIPRICVPHLLIQVDPGHYFDTRLDKAMRKPPSAAKQVDSTDRAVRFHALRGSIHIASSRHDSIR